MLSLLLAGPGPAGAAEEQLGKVHFATSCNDVAQRRFDRALRYQHSFWYRESKEIFEEVLKADPACAIAYWGIAQSLMANPFNPTPKKNLEEGLAAIQKGRAIGAKTARENDLIAAIGGFYTDFEKLDQKSRVQAYTNAMEQVASRYPDDDEVQIYYALALDIAASPSDKTYANQLKAAAILEPIFRRQPEHPGVAHYLVHTYDYPPIAAKGLDAAKRYARIAEAAPHAQHMPSHIFTRVGYWAESIASNTAAARLAKAGHEGDDELHASDYLVYALLQLGRDREARTVMDQMGGITGYNPERNTGPFALAASPARYVVERGDWKAAAELPLQSSRFAYVDAMAHFARALGAARSGHADAAKAEIAALAALRDKLRASKDAYWADQVDIQWQAASAWAAEADGGHDEALRLMNAAADAEDKSEKATVTPGPIVPARQLLGDMLLARGRTKDALAAFEASLTKEPNRLGSLLGAAKAAERAGEADKARAYYAKVVGMAAQADPVRTEVAEARAFLASMR
jgi:Tfp pilus assembly protein PilF